MEKFTSLILRTNQQSEANPSIQPLTPKASHDSLLRLRPLRRRTRALTHLSEPPEQPRLPRIQLVFKLYHFRICINSSRTHPFRERITSTSRLDPRTRSCQSSSLAIANCEFTPDAFGPSPSTICLPTGDPLRHQVPIHCHTRNNAPHSNLRRSTCSTDGRPSNLQLGHTGLAATRFPGFAYNLILLGGLHHHDGGGTINVKPIQSQLTEFCMIFHSDDGKRAHE